MWIIIFSWYKSCGLVKKKNEWTNMFTVHVCVRVRACVCECVGWVFSVSFRGLMRCPTGGGLLSISSLPSVNLCCTIWCTYVHNNHSPTLYSKITGEYAYLGSKIFPHILLLCSISYSCDNGLTINQHFIKPLQGEKCTSYLSVVDLSIVLPRVFFFAALCGRTNLRLRSRARTF